ncbi:MAG TPA: TonB-dependent receptor plug domain-containing protein, partial [Segetibacter sp.]
MRKLFTFLAAFVLLTMSSYAQSRTISGTVTDNNGTVVPGASVVAKPNGSGTITNNLGRFTLQVGPTVRTIEVSAINFATQTVSLSNLSNYEVKLQTSQGDLGEVVVVGYGVQRRREVTGNVATVAGAAIADKPIQSFEQGLAGRAAGVQITVPNGVLNTPPVFRIRGTNSISLSSQPLIVIDGVASLSGSYSSSSAGGNALASLNPNDIESIDIAKDAASTAIYGSRAANGVVFITTKRGRAGKARISYNSSVGWTETYR